MRIDKVYIEDYKNLKKFEIDLDEKEMKTVLLGQNATGKSNFMEALILIFKYLDLEQEPPEELNLKYKIIYTCNNYQIAVDNLTGKYHFDIKTYINFKGKNIPALIYPKKITKTHFFKNKDKYLPKYIFAYYSGLSNKLNELFWEHQRNFYKKIIKEDFKDKEIDSLRRLFYVKLVHSYFVLLAYFTPENKENRDFLLDVFNIEQLESILFVLQMPDWAKDKAKKNPDDIFWTAAGLVRSFLDKLWELSLAPIYNDERIQIDFDDYQAQNRLYLYIKGKEELNEITKFYGSNTALFKALESTYISKLIADVRIKVRKKNVDNSITFKELSEGEQQLLTVLGLLKFTKDENSLILLDEPDTHLNPIWKWRYMEFLDKVVNKPESTQIIINTHDPLIIGNLKKEEVRLFQLSKEGKIYTEKPTVDPRGLGVEGILTSEFFGLPAIIDDYTKSKLDKRNELLLKQQRNEISEKEQAKLRELFEELEDLGFSNTYRDPLYQKFIIAYKKRIKEKGKMSFSKEEIETQNRIAFEILNELSKED